MASRVYFLQLFDADFGVYGCGVELCMAKQLLDYSDVCAVFEHVGGATVTHGMATALAF